MKLSPVKHGTRSISFALVAIWAWSAGTLAEEPAPQVMAQLHKAVVAIRSIDPGDEDFSDLAPLKQAIGDSRVVLLGEASHRDGSAFLAKTRLIKFLHRELGFDVLIWEWSTYDCLRANDALRRGVSFQDALGERLLSMWSDSTECSALFKFIEQSFQSPRPLTQAGLAYYFTADSPFFEDIVRFLKQADPSLPTPAQREALDAARRFYRNLGQYAFPKTATPLPHQRTYDAVIQLLETDPTGAFGQHYSIREVVFMKLALQNLVAHLSYFHRPLSRGGSDDSPIGVQEGHNVVFLAKQYFPQRKLIVWCHNGHLARNTPQIEDLSRLRFNESATMGGVAFKELGAEMYSILFLSRRGQWGYSWADTRTVPEARADSLESALGATGVTPAFIDLRALPAGHTLRTRWVASPVAYAAMRADWSTVADGLFFIADMVPSTRPQP